MKHLSRKYKKRILRKNKISKKKIKPKKSVNRKSIKKSVNRKKTTTRKRRRVGGSDSDSEDDDEVAKYFLGDRNPTPYNHIRRIQSSDIEQGDTNGEIEQNNTRKVKPSTSFLNSLRSFTPSNFLRRHSTNKLGDGESGRESKESLAEKGKELPFENYKLTVEGELLTENTSPFNSQEEEQIELLGVKVNKADYDEYVTNFNKLEQKRKTDSYKRPLTAHDYDMVMTQFNNFLGKYSSVISDDDKDFYLSKLTDPEFVDDIDTIIGKLEENIIRQQEKINIFKTKPKYNPSKMQPRSSSFVNEISSGHEGYKTAESGRRDSTSSDESVDSTIALITRGKPVDSKVNKSFKDAFKKAKEDAERKKEEDTIYRKEDYYSEENMEKLRREKKENLEALKKQYKINFDSDSD